MLAHSYSNDFFITTNKTDILAEDVKTLLSLTHWACNRSQETIQVTIDNSMCFGVYDESDLIGFARVITDYATFAYISDVVIDPSYRGKQLGHWLIKSILKHEHLKTIPQWRLKTTYAHSFYNSLGFKKLNSPDNHLEYTADF